MLWPMGLLAGQPIIGLVHRWLVPYVVAPLYEACSGQRPWSEARRLRKLQWISPDELEARAIGRLRPLLEHAVGHVPYYRELFLRAGLRPQDVRTYADLARLPITTKSELRDRFPDGVVAANLPGSAATAVDHRWLVWPFLRVLRRSSGPRRLGGLLYFFQEWANAPIWQTKIWLSSAAIRRSTSPSCQRWPPGPPAGARGLAAYAAGDRSQSWSNSCRRSSGLPGAGLTLCRGILPT